MKQEPSKEAPSIITIRSDLDIVAARMAARMTARQMGFNAIDQARIATATSELTRNILMHANEGVITIREVHHKNLRGIEIVFEDQGPGIPDASIVSSHNTTPTNMPGVGLVGSRRLMDQLEIDSTTGMGTRIICQKWLR